MPVACEDKPEVSGSDGEGIVKYTGTGVDAVVHSTGVVDILGLGGTNVFVPGNKQTMLNKMNLEYRQ